MYTTRGGDGKGSSIGIAQVVAAELLDLPFTDEEPHLVDGHGIAHPRRAGLASHLGVILDVPAIGCAKTPLGGDWHEPPEEPGAWSEVRYEGDLVGAAYRSRAGSQPLFLSPGHRVDLPSIIALLPKLLREHRLPEPLAQAHEAAVKTRARHEKAHPRP